MKVYIAGAITNNPRYKERFEEAEKRLISMGHAVINPVKNIVSKAKATLIVTNSFIIN